MPARVDLRLAEVPGHGALELPEIAELRLDLTDQEATAWRVEAVDVDETVRSSDRDAHLLRHLPPAHLETPPHVGAAASMDEVALPRSCDHVRWG
jgi:hypothetical protein